jgi:HEAT repeat protein
VLRVLFHASLLVALAAVPGVASAQDMSMREIRALLDGHDPDGVRLALETLGQKRSAAAIATIGDRIRRGLPPGLLDAAIDALGAAPSASAMPLYVELLHHRQASVRRRAVALIAGVRGPAAELIGALDDLDAGVRTAVAEALANVRAPAAIDPLFRALDRGVTPAAVAIGKTANAAGITRLAGLLGRVPLETLAPGLREALLRGDLPNRVKLEVVARLQELGTPPVRELLESLFGELTAGSPLHRAVQDAALRIPGAG